MVKRRIDIALLAVIMLCSNSFYKLIYLGPLEKGSELLGSILIFVLIFLHLIYSGEKGIKRNFTVPIVLILLSLVTSTITAYVTRDQRIISTIFAQRALYYYFLYFLLHQMKFESKDIEKLIIFFALVYIALHFVQTILYPNVLFNATVYAERGTIRIYLPGAHYIAVAFLLVLQRFTRNGGLMNLILMLVILSVYVMRGGRLPLAILVLTIVLFIMFNRKVRSRFFLIFLGLVGGFAIFIIFQNIFLELIATSERNAAMGQDYIRFKAARYFLTEFFESPVAYITGNGMSHIHSSYGKLMAHNKVVYNYNLGDVGIIGNYAIYGFFFVIGVIAICLKAMGMKIQPGQSYTKYYFIAVIIGLVISGGFTSSDFICLIVCIIYMIDVSKLKSREEIDVSPGIT